MTKLLDAVRTKSEEKAKAKQVLTDEMLARNGRPAKPKPQDLSNTLPERKPGPTDGFYDLLGVTDNDPALWDGSDEPAFELPGLLDHYQVVTVNVGGMSEPDQATARALTEAGYMPLTEYLRYYGVDDDA
jgi:hypothetical protein